MKRAAIFVHGWAVDDRIFHRLWLREKGAPLFELLDIKFGYDPKPMTLPGNYLDLERDFHFYARRILEELSGLDRYDEFLLLGHSMGAISIRTLLAYSFGERLESAKKKIKRVILIGAPNYGTVQPIIDSLSRILTSIGHLVLPENITDLGKARTSYLKETPCYRDLLPEGEFIRELNRRARAPEWIEMDNIWTLDDTVVEPSHSSILPGVRNHLIDSISVNHLNMLSRKEVLGTVKDIMEGSASPSGPQVFPDMEGCSKRNEHVWHPDAALPLMERRILWKCRACLKETWTHLLPEPFGCPESRISEGPHSWTRVPMRYSFRYRCLECGELTWHPLSGDE
jgi:pimeloyl-ACP methyl ester carboxylesterase